MRTKSKPRFTDLQIAQRWAARWDRHRDLMDWVRACASRRVQLPDATAHILKCPNGHHELAVIDDGSMWPRVRCSYCLFAGVDMLRHHVESLTRHDDLEQFA